MLGLKGALLTDYTALVPSWFLQADSRQIGNIHDGSSDLTLPTTQPT